MKNVAKYSFAVALSSLVLFSGVAGVTPAKANALSDLLSGASAATVTETELKVENVSVLAGEKFVSLMWDPVVEGSDTLTKYEILYGKESVEEGIAESYETVLKISLEAEELETVGVAKTDITGLRNGDKYFFAVKAIASDGSKGSVSSEVFATPASADVADDGADSSESKIFKLDKAIALTTGIVKAELSKEVVLPEDPEILKASFVVNIKNDPDTILEISDVQLRENYYRTRDQLEGDAATSDDEVYIFLKDLVELEKDYQITVSARVRDVDDSVIENGVVDNLFFLGTDALEISEEEQGEYLKVEETPETTPEETPESTPETTPEVTPTPQAESTEEDEKTAEVGDSEKKEPLHESPNDITPPEDVTNLKADLQKRINDFLVKLSWDKSKNTAGDLIQQLLYVSVDGGKTWGKAKELGNSIENYTFSGTENKEYVVKLTTKDRVGNESNGVIKTINISALTQTGAPIFVALGLALMGGGTILASRRRK